MEILVASEHEVPSRLRHQVVALQDQAWPPGAPSQAPTGHDPSLAPVSVLLLEGDRVVAALDILSKDLEHAGERYRAGGLSTVVTDAARRRQGMGLELVSAARDRIAADGADLVLFTCDAPLVPFYERAGFEVLAGTQVIGGTPADPLPSGPLGKVTLAALLTPHAQAHHADFVDTDLELYPGPVDRLW